MIIQLFDPVPYLGAGFYFIEIIKNIERAYRE